MAECVQTSVLAVLRAVHLILRLRVGSSVSDTFKLRLGDWGFEAYALMFRL